MNEEPKPVDTAAVLARLDDPSTPWHSVARNDIPPLVDEVEHLRAQLAAVRKILFEDASLGWEYTVRRIAAVLEDDVRACTGCNDQCSYCRSRS